PALLPRQSLSAGFRFPANNPSPPAPPLLPSAPRSCFLWPGMALAAARLSEKCGRKSSGDLGDRPQSEHLAAWTCPLQILSVSVHPLPSSSLMHLIIGFIFPQYK